MLDRLSEFRSVLGAMCLGGSAKAKRERREGVVKGGGAEPGNGAQAFADKPPARAPEGELARRLPSRRGCPKRRVLKGRSLF